MAVIIDGSTGIKSVNGSAAAPSVTGTDTDTGIVYGTNTITLATGGTAGLIQDASQNVGIGAAPLGWSGSKSLTLLTPSGSVYTSLFTVGNTVGMTSNAYYDGTNWKYGINYNAQQYYMGDGSHIWRTASASTGTISWSESMRIDSSGNVGIGTSTPQARLHANAAVNTTSLLLTPNNAASAADYTQLGFGVGYATSTVYGGIRTAFVNPASTTAVSMQFFTDIGGSNYAERMRIDSSGNLLVGTTNPSVAAGVGFKINYNSNVPNVGQVFDTAGGYNSYHLYNVNATNNGYRFYVAANGGIYNFSGNNGNLSDERTKTNIELSGGYLEKICAIPVKLFNYKDEPENEQRTLGVIAQDVEAVAPELVNQNGWLGDAPEGEAPLKSIYTTDMMFALMKAIQEQQAIIEQLKADVAELKAAK